MFSYRHAYHAGAHSDVLKHSVLVHLLQYLAQKDKSFWMVDTHAGAVSYSLRGEHARRSGEAQGGIVKIWGREDAPPLVRSYLEVVKADDNPDELRYYPGSPWISDHLLRRQDRLRLFELHPTDSSALRKHFKNNGPRVMAFDADGFDGLAALLPPPPRRGLTLIDPSYEDKRDYRRVIAALKAGLERFETGTFMVWYPQIERPEAKQFSDQLKRVRRDGWLHATLTVKAPSPDGLGITGSGVFLIHPPYTLAPALKEALPWLVKALGQDGGAQFRVEASAA